MTGPDPDPRYGRRYQAIRLVGKGANGEVYEALDTRLERRVAVKVFGASPDFDAGRQRFTREARLLGSHPHPAIVAVLDVDMESDPPFLVLAWMPGGDLADLLRLSGALPAAEVVRIGARLASALAHLHGLGILHRDVKLENVLRDEAGEVALADLGLAAGEGMAPLTKTGFLVGTPRYMAPELAHEGVYSAASDLFALGVVLAELGTGQRRSVSAPDRDRESEDLAGSLEPASLRTLVRSLLHSQPGWRPASAREIAERLDAIGSELSGAPVGRVPTSTLEDATSEVPGSTVVAPGRPSAVAGQEAGWSAVRRRAAGAAVGALVALLAMSWARIRPVLGGDPGSGDPRPGSTNVPAPPPGPGAAEALAKAMAPRRRCLLESWDRTDPAALEGLAARIERVADQECFQRRGELREILARALDGGRDGATAPVLEASAPWFEAAEQVRLLTMDLGTWNLERFDRRDEFLAMTERLEQVQDLDRQLASEILVPRFSERAGLLDLAMLAEARRTDLLPGFDDVLLARRLAAGLRDGGEVAGVDAAGTALARLLDHALQRAQTDALGPGRPLPLEHLDLLVGLAIRPGSPDRHRVSFLDHTLALAAHYVFMSAFRDVVPAVRAAELAQRLLDRIEQDGGRARFGYRLPEEGWWGPRQPASNATNPAVAALRSRILSLLGPEASPTGR